MNFISICSGIEAASVAFGPLGWKALAFAEIEPFPCAVLAHHYPDVPNYGDMTAFRQWPEQIFESADAIVGGPPCQAFSVAGLRKGLDDARGNLTLTYAEMINHADAIRLRHGKPPVIVLYENVPGLLSDKSGAYGCFLAALAGEDDPLEPPGGGAGRTLVMCLVPKEQSRGGPLTPNISEWPNDAAVCSLSQVLETILIPQRFFLSLTACAGILRRAEKRGKQLPEPLRLALQAVAGVTAQTMQQQDTCSL